ncbi:probable serine carboxypeptidase CPVL [Bemisia tabaci]
MRDDFGRNPNSTEEKFYNHPETRQALHAGHRAFSNGKTIEFHMLPEMGQSAIPTFEGLLATDIDILFLTGQQDMSYPYIVFEELFTSLRWPGAADFNAARRCQFRINDRVAGYYRSVRRFTEVLIRGAGHIIYGTQPKTTYRVIDKFIRNTKNFQCT